MRIKNTRRSVSTVACFSKPIMKVSAITCQVTQSHEFLDFAKKVIKRMRNFDKDIFNSVDLAKALKKINEIRVDSLYNLGYLGKLYLEIILTNTSFILYCYGLMKAKNINMVFSKEGI